MDASTITIISSTLEVLGIGVFVNYLIRGINAKIGALEQTIDIQKGTISAMNERVAEVKKMGETWEELSKALPKYFHDFDEVISTSKERQIQHLESEIALYERKLKKYESIENPESAISSYIIEKESNS